jgi:hypothetical protein
MNKKGISLGGLSEGILGIILILSCFGLIIISMNNDYGKNYDATLGLATNSTLTKFISHQQVIQSSIDTGQASTNTQTGISLTTLWSLTYESIKLCLNFVTGSWIENIIGLLHFGMAGVYLAIILRLALVFSLGYIIIKLIMKVKP